MARAFWKSRLSLQLIIGVLISLLVAVLVFFLVGLPINDRLTAAYHQKDFKNRQEVDCITRLQSFIDENGLTVNDQIQLHDWVRDEKFVYLTLYLNQTMVYDSSLFPETITGSSFSDYAYNQEGKYYTLQFKDVEVEAEVSCFYEYRFRALIVTVSGVAAFFCFVITLMLFIHRKTAYIDLLETEMSILEGGDLNYPITIRGKDELTYLAKSIESMRLSILDQLRKENEAKNANQELITAISHDLRTPLTSLIGFLDIVELKKYQNEEQLEHFLHSSREKAYQIKAMSDKLFEYFLVYGKEQDEWDTQSYDGAELFQQIIGENLFDLESKGFPVEAELCEMRCRLWVNIDMIRRMFDNVFSNVSKYGDRSSPVRAVVQQQEGKIRVTVENRINPKASRKQSTEIGLKTCERIAQCHHGSFSYTSTGSSFGAVIELPAIEIGH